MISERPTPECLLFPKAAVQIGRNWVKLGSANGQKRTFAPSKKKPRRSGVSRNALPSIYNRPSSPSLCWRPPYCLTKVQFLGTKAAPRPLSSRGVGRLAWCASLVNRRRTTGRSVAPDRPPRNQAPKLQWMPGKIRYSNDVLFHTVRLNLDWSGTRGQAETAAKQ